MGGGGVVLSSLIARKSKIKPAAQGKHGVKPGVKPLLTAAHLAFNSPGKWAG